MIRKNIFKNAVFSSVVALSIFASGTLWAVYVPADAQVTIEDQVESSLGIPGTDYAEGEVIVTLAAPSEESSELLDEGVVASDTDIVVEDVMEFGDATDIAQTQAQARELSDDTLYVSVVSSDEYSTTELINKLSDEDNVISVSPNYRMKKLTNDSLYDHQWSLGGSAYSSGGQPVRGIGYTDEVAPSDSSSTVVAVVDDGICYDHEDLADNIWTNPYSSAKLTGKHGYDFVNGDDDPYPNYADDTHGTHVAGIIAASSGNSVGVAGESSAKLMACKVFDDKNDNSGMDSVILQAFEYIYKAQQLGVNIAAVNCSFGMEPSDKYTSSSSQRSTFNTIVNKIGAAGALFVFASGNDSTDVTKYAKGFPYYLDRDYVLMVGSSSFDDSMSSFSDYSKTQVDVLAPGSQILSTVSEDTFLPSSYDENKRNRLCLLYEDFDSGLPSIYTINNLSGKSSTALSISRGSEDFFGSSTGGSLAVKVNYVRTISITAGTFFVDVTDLGLDVGSNTYYISYDIAFDDEANGDWLHQSSKLARTSLYSIGKRVYLRFVLPSMVGATVSRLSGHTIYFDNIAISVPNPDTSEFGKYDYMSGTSMAAPSASGAVARLAALYPNADAKSLKQMIYKSVRAGNNTENTCITGGIIDMSRFTDSDVADLTEKTVKVTKVKLNKSSATLRAGKKLTLKATISPSTATTKKVKWSVSNTTYASVSSKGVVKAKKKGIGHTVKVTATATDGSKKKATCKIKIKK